MQDPKSIPRLPTPKPSQTLRQGKVTYEQQRILCGKDNCAACRNANEDVRGHGPYWYMTFTALGRERRAYIGKTLDLGKHRVGIWIDYRGQNWWKRLVHVCGRLSPKDPKYPPDCVLPIEFGAVCAESGISKCPYPPRSVAATAWQRGFNEHLDLTVAAGPVDSETDDDSTRSTSPDAHPENAPKPTVDYPPGTHLSQAAYDDLAMFPVKIPPSTD